MLELEAQHGAEAAKASLAGLEPAAGLKVELFASDPLLFNPVAFTIDEHGRFFIAESHRWKDSVFDLWTKDERWKLADFSFTRVEQREAFLRAEFATNLTLLTKDSELIRLVEDKDGNGVAESSSVFADGFNQVTSGTAAGVLASQGQLWFTCIPDLWKFEYDSEGKIRSREVLHTGYGVRTSVSGHDLHGLVRGLDGRIYFSVGDRGANVRSKEGKELESVNSGAVFRCEPDGSNLELFAVGLRNPQDLAFDQFGNLWTHDNDTSGDDPPRVLQVVEGGDYGWRQAYQFMPEFGPWVRERVWEGKLDDVLPPAGFGAQGPSGLAAYPGVGLPEKYRGSLLACDFPQGVWAYFFKPNGATYQLQKERFLWGLGPTDVDFGPEGHVYISDWGRSYAMPNGGRLLKIFTAIPDPSASEIKQLLTGGIKSASTEQLAKWMSHPDMRVRTAAQFELEQRKSADVLASVARGENNQVARIHALWGLGNLGRRKQVDPAAAFAGLAADPDPEIRAQAAQQLGQISLSEASTRKLLELTTDSHPRVQMFSALSLAHATLLKKEVANALLRLAEGTGAQEAFVRHAVVYAMVKRGDLEAIEAAARHSDPNCRRVAVLAWRRLQSPNLASFLDDHDLTVRRDAARAINDVPVPQAFPALAKKLVSSEADAQILLRAINANFRLGGLMEWERVLRFAGNPEAPEALRVDALGALSQWSQPSPLDRVMGIWRPLHGERKTGDRKRLVQTMRTFFEQKTSTNLLLAALECAEKINLRDVEIEIEKQVANTLLPDTIRSRALRVLGKIKATNLSVAVNAALADKNPSLRAEAVSLLPQVAPEKAVLLIEHVLRTERDLRIQQSAIAALGKLQNPAAVAFLEEAIQKFSAGSLKPELHLDLLEAAEALEKSGLRSPALQSFGTATNSLARYDWALTGGNAALGKKIFFERDALGCVRCHAVKGQGGIVGPDLAGIGGQRERKHLLESIVHPNAHLVTGYESVSLSLKDGRSYAGNVKSENEQELVVDSPEDGMVTVKKAEIQTRTQTLSPMPEGLAELMSRRELRDLVEYLASLK